MYFMFKIEKGSKVTATKVLSLFDFTLMDEPMYILATGYGEASLFVLDAKVSNECPPQDHSDHTMSLSDLFVYNI